MTTKVKQAIGVIERLGGTVELHLEGQTLMLEPGDLRTVPKGASHSYTILEPFTAVEATRPPAHGRDHR